MINSISSVRSSYNKNKTFKGKFAKTMGTKPNVSSQLLYSSLIMLLIRSSTAWTSRRRFPQRISRAARHLSAENPILSSRLDGLDRPTVWHEFSPLAVEHNSVNLGQGYPDWDPPAFCRAAFETSLDPAAGRNAAQYARSAAHLPLAQVLAQDYSERFDRDIDPATEIATAVGCTNALYCALQGLIDPGDEVILLEPAFDIYQAQVRMAGGKSVFVPLRPSGSVKAGASAYFKLDMDELKASISEKTKVLLLNSPHNPTGKIFSQSELKAIADIAKEHPRLTIISDEVYEHIIFEPEKEPHISIASMLWDQTLTLSSSGKTFSCTGWKIGWAVGPSRLVHAVRAAQQWVNFSAPTPNQDAIAQALVQAREPYEGYETFYHHVADDYKSKRQVLLDALDAGGMTPIVPNGGFFIMADTSNIDFPLEDYQKNVQTEAMPAHPMPRDWALSRWLTETVGVTAIPPSAFYKPETLHLASNLLRFAFCKNEATIREAQVRFEQFFGKK